MWTYNSENTENNCDCHEHPSAEPMPSTVLTKERTTGSTIHNIHKKRSAPFRLPAYYLTGLTISTLVFHYFPQLFENYKIYTTVNFKMQKSELFCSIYIAYILQLTLILIAGLSVAGSICLPFLLALKGFGIGCFSSFTIQSIDFKPALIQYASAIWLPELIFLAALYVLSRNAFALSKTIFSILNGKHIKPLSPKLSRLFVLYLASLLYSIIPAYITCQAMVGY